MLLSKRFWGMFVAGFGSLNFLPEAVTGFFGNAENRELIAWAAVVIAGYAFYRYGQHKATKALK